MSDPQLPREVRRRLAIIRHAEEVTGNVIIHRSKLVHRWLGTIPGWWCSTARATAHTTIPSSGSGRRSRRGWRTRRR